LQSIHPEIGRKNPIKGALGKPVENLKNTGRYQAVLSWRKSLKSLDYRGFVD
jgi:hypothetical protein